MTNQQSRVKKLEARREPAPDVLRVDLMKPSEIVARCDELTAAGVIATDEQRARIESMRQALP